MIMARELLDRKALDQALAGLSWTREGYYLVKTVSLADFMAAIMFVNRVADLAEALDHHPDIAVSGNKVSLRVTTHDAGGLTSADVDLARAVDTMAQATQDGPGR